MICAAAQAGSPIVLLERKVPQFREAAAGAMTLVTGAEVDVGDADAPARLSQASVVIAIGQKAFQFALEKVPKTAIVFCLTLGVARSQLSDTITGVPFEPDPLTTVATIQEVVPTAKRIGMIYNPSVSEWFAAEALRAAKAAGLVLVTRSAATPQEARDVAQGLIQGSDVLWLPPDPKLFPKDLVVYLLSVSAERSLPVIGFLDSMAQAGALASLSTDFGGAGRQAGKLAAETLSRPEGQRVLVPAPAWAPGKLTLNLKTAEALHIQPTAAAVNQASQVLK